jgi:hypothetical protein
MKSSSLRVPGLAIAILAMMQMMAGCGGGSSDTEVAGNAVVASSADPSTGNAQAPSSFNIYYGRHFPNGEAAVDYLLSPEGTWKQVTSIEYLWNYYPDCASSAKPFDRDTLIRSADGTRDFTAPDANCNLLFDVNQDGAIDPESRGFAFHEHNGRGVNGAEVAQAFTNFWYDDNRLAQLMMQAYGRPSPAGLGASETFSRWQVLTGRMAQWTPYNDDHFDRLALDALYLAATGNLQSAMHKWRRIRDLSECAYDVSTNRYDYPRIEENYHLGLFLILTSVLVDATSEESTRRELLQHKVSIHSHLLSNQEVGESNLLGWRSGIADSRTLINTESVSVAVLSLATGALEVFEPGRAPLRADPNHFVARDSHVLSAVVGVSSPGYLIAGPGRAYAPGNYEVELLVRSTGPAVSLARVEIVDKTTNRILLRSDLTEQQLKFDGLWTAVRIPFTLSNPESVIDFGVYWHGGANMDVAFTRVRRADNN